MKNSIILFALISIGISTSYAQRAGGLAIDTPTYKTGLGLRAGETSGFTIKHFFTPHDALEGIVGIWHHGFSLTALYERHQGAFGVSGLNWYFGGGAHMSLAAPSRLYAYRKGNKRYTYYVNGSFGTGIDGIFGMEYKIPKTPLAVSLDIKPYVEFISTGGIWTSLDPGLGIKLTL